VSWFVGLPVAAGRWFEPLVADAPAGVRVFHPADLHATVAFLGDCGPEAAHAAWGLAAGLSAVAIPVRLGALALMGNPRRPSALSLVLDRGQAEVVAVIAALRDPMIEAAGARPEAREPRAHVTVARPSRQASPAQRRRACEWALAKRPVMAEVVLDRLALFTWAEDRRERQFRIVAEQPLTPACKIG
jgi:2'-5' RNA ligase